MIDGALFTRIRCKVLHVYTRRNIILGPSSRCAEIPDYGRSHCHLTTNASPAHPPLVGRFHQLRVASDNERVAKLENGPSATSDPNDSRKLVSFG